VTVGSSKKVIFPTIIHSNALPVIVKSETIGKEWFFLLGRWLAKDEEDGKIEIEVDPKDQDGQASLPVSSYRVSVLTVTPLGFG
jgi:hypothetical protein